MKNKTQDWIAVGLGVWLLISPWLLQYAAASRAAWNSYIVAIFLIGFGLAAIYTKVQWHFPERLKYIVLGVYLIFSPWLLGFAALPAAVWNAVIVGILAVAVGIWALTQEGSPDRPHA